MSTSIKNSSSPTGTSIEASNSCPTVDRGERINGSRRAGTKDRNDKWKKKAAPQYLQAKRSSGHFHITKSRKYPIGERELKDILDKPAFIISRRLISEGSGYDLLISSEKIKPEKLDLLLQVLFIAVQYTTDSAAILQLLLLTFQKPQFVNQLCDYASGLKFHLDKGKEYLPYIAKIIEIFVRLTPVEAALKVSSLIDICMSVLKVMKEQDEVDHSVLETAFISIQAQIVDSQKTWRQQRINSRVAKLDSITPPQNFRTLNVIPTIKELLTNEEPFLRRNIINGRYSNCEHYLDVQFRLYKEDFVRPLRNGLIHFLGGSSVKNRDVKVYRKVSFCITKLEERGIIIYLQLDLPKHFKLNQSKRLMFGNIVCLSSDNFKSMVIASVDNRDESEQCRIGVKYEMGNFDRTYFENSTLTMIESKAFFESYSHTLFALQKIYKMPFENTIIMVEDSRKAPGYLKPKVNDIYDFSVLTRKNMKIESNCVNEEDDCTSSNMKKSNCISNDIEESDCILKAVHILSDLSSWPSCTDLQLDDSQRKALHNALTQEVSIIQGPPGTGKTYVGFQIAKILLHNKCTWHMDYEVETSVEDSTKETYKSKGPILVVCYTNHALDQFLEGITLFTESIIRVGSRSKNEKLQNYNIKRVKCLDDVGTTLHYSFKDTWKKIDQLKEEISAVDSKLISLEIDIVNSASFQKWNIIPPGFLLQLGYLGLTDYLICLSLNAVAAKECRGTEHYEKIAAKYINDVHKKAEKEEKLYDDDELFSEEQNSRIIDDDLNQLDNEASKLRKDSIPIQIDIDIEACYNEIIRCISEIERLQIEKGDKDTIFLINSNYEQIFFCDKLIECIKNGLSKRGSTDECEKFELARNIDSLTYDQRWMLYNHWKDKLAAVIKTEKQELEKKFLETAKNLESLRAIEYLNAMRKVDVVGMTTTAAARHYNILHDLAPPIVIVEEAAEILETHVVTSLSEHCQHLILIGDHQQLKPNPSVYQLATEYNLNVSLFERLIRNGINYTCLEYQHRMKPCISRLLVPTIYNNLKDHPSVLAYPKIRGIDKDIFFLDHTNPENSVKDENESASNDFESKFAVALCQHLLFQGYDTDEITILTPYSGQHSLIKQCKRNYPHCDKVRVAILDNYQGEESNIIILSLVRSNEEDKAGFVKIDNRICVAISRAKRGFYMVGNMALLARASPIWCEIRGKLVEDGSIGTEMKLKCEIHGQDIIVKSDQDILLQSPEGGCSRNCLSPFPKCDHFCPRKCHGLDPHHTSLKCNFPCSKILCELDHPCPDLCFQECGNCKVMVEKILPCGHGIATMECSMQAADFPCPTEIEAELPDCKHNVRKQCYEVIKNIECLIKCDCRLDCGHQCKRNCHVTDDLEHEDYDCRAACERTPDNCQFDHKCPKLCFEDCGVCRKIIKRNLKCGHTKAKVLCGLPEAQIKCKQKCQKTLPCSHKCQKLCYEPCGGCKVQVEKTLPKCGHAQKMYCCISVSDFSCPTNVVVELPLCGHQMGKKCAEDINKVVCKSKCDARLDCSHKCVMKCHVTTDEKHAIYNCREKCEKTPENCKFEHKCPKLCFEQCGPCTKIIKIRLSCGHQEQRVECGLPPETILCKQKCQKTLPCGHKCQKLCHEECGPCEVPVKKTINGCLHVIKMKCGMDPSTEACTAACPKSLSCGHPCGKRCSDICTTYCEKLVPSTMVCRNNHVIKVKCHELALMSASQTFLSRRSYDQKQRCQEICGAKLRCGHQCKQKCSDCYSTGHKDCKDTCNKTLICGHLCSAPCCVSCPPCQSNCPVKCSHRTCTKKCGYVCTPCKKMCERRCAHVRCYKKCDEPCYIQPCRLPCPKKLSCKHPCIGFCGEPCPKLCRICHREQVTQSVFRTEDQDNARFVVLEDCQHVFESSYIERWLSVGDIGIKNCRRCKAPICNTQRFKSQIYATLNVVRQSRLNYSEGTIFSIKLRSSSPEELLISLKVNGVVKVHQFDNKKPLFLLTFNTSHLPSNISLRGIGLLSVRPFNPNRHRCGDNNCIISLYEKEVYKIKAEEKISLHEAKMKACARKSPSGLTYSFELQKIRRVTSSVEKHSGACNKSIESFFECPSKMKSCEKSNVRPVAQNVAPVPLFSDCSFKANTDGSTC